MTIAMPVRPRAPEREKLMTRSIAWGAFPLVGLMLAIAGCEPSFAVYYEYEEEDYGDYELVYLQSEHGHLAGRLGDIETIDSAASYTDAFMDSYSTTIAVYAEAPGWIAMSAIVLQSSDREAVFIPGTRLQLGSPDGATSYAWGCSGVGPEPTLDYEVTGQTTDVIVSEGEDEGTVIVTYSTTYSTEYGPQTLRGSVQLVVP
jgi:hypothetical protein